MIKSLKDASKRLNASFVSDVSGGFADAFLHSPSFPLRAAAALCFAAFSLALILSFVFGGKGVRHVFFFPAQTVAVENAAPGKSGGFSKLVPEIRYVACPDDDSGRLSVYVEELLLGPSEPVSVPLFQSDCALGESFVRGNEAFINISPVSPPDTLASPFFARQCDLFKKNVCINFKNIDTIHLYFDGIEVYSEKR